MDKRPIGVFESGLGGLSAVKELAALLPHEDIVYFGDTARVPYGPRSRDTLLKYAHEDIHFLISKKVKLALAACGTISSIYPPKLAQKLPVPYLGVVEPTAKAAVAASRTGHIGIIGTRATIKSNSYANAILKLLPQAKLTSMACPLFVPVIEGGYIDRTNPITTTLAQEYLLPLVNEGIDTLILGCTHYPIIRDIIADVVGPDVVLIDSGRESALAARDLLSRQELLAERERAGRLSFYVSDSPDSFAEIGGLFLGSQLTGTCEQVSVG